MMSREAIAEAEAAGVDMSDGAAVFDHLPFVAYGRPYLLPSWTPRGVRMEPRYGIGPVTSEFQRRSAAQWLADTWEHYPKRTEGF